MRQPGFVDLPELLQRLAEADDRLETMASAVEFQLFRPTLDEGLG